VRTIFAVAARPAEEERRAPAQPEFEAEHRVKPPQGAGGIYVVRVEDGVFAIEGRGVEMLVERHDLRNDEALSYLERRLNEIGVIKALRDAGFEAGDEVRVAGEAFELDPGDP
jgi:GTP-binding protein